MFVYLFWHILKVWDNLICKHIGKYPNFVVMLIGVNDYKICCLALFSLSKVTYNLKILIKPLYLLLFKQRARK